LLLNSTHLFGQDNKTGIKDMFALFTEEDIVISALKRPQTVLKSPSVITAKQIKQMGFRTLIDVLKIVPGFYISMDETDEREIAVRGVLETPHKR